MPETSLPVSQTLRVVVPMLSKAKIYCRDLCFFVVAVPLGTNCQTAFGNFRDGQNSFQPHIFMFRPFWIHFVHVVDLLIFSKTV
jgi:hypothetical protein